MSPVSTVRRYYELVDSGDFPELVSLFAPNARYHRPGYPPLVGRAALERFYREQRVIKEGSHVLAMVVSAANDVAVHGEFNGVLHNGQKIAIRFADFFSVGPDGQFTHRDTFFFSPAV